MTSVGARVTYSELLECLTCSLNVGEIRGVPIGGCFSYCRESNATANCIYSLSMVNFIWEKDVLPFLLQYLEGCFFMFRDWKKNIKKKKTPGSNIQFKSILYIVFNFNWTNMNSKDRNVEQKLIFWKLPFHQFWYYALKKIACHNSFKKQDIVFSLVMLSKVIVFMIRNSNDKINIIKKNLS